jgi:hypothetical protein
MSFLFLKNKKKDFFFSTLLFTDKKIGENIYNVIITHKRDIFMFSRRKTHVLSDIQVENVLFQHYIKKENKQKRIYLPQQQQQQKKKKASNHLRWTVVLQLSRIITIGRIAMNPVTQRSGGTHRRRKCAFQEIVKTRGSINIDIISIENSLVVLKTSVGDVDVGGYIIKIQRSTISSYAFGENAMLYEKQGIIRGIKIYRASRRSR